ncbi:alpha/beta hydrolase [Prosthecomicrobium sp. N25]|uniref:alpha/beta hydrolase n=1 Tax=Prosthecomicrobium sp. N25 TaxID=3129254 RepID=UPI00307738F1
MTLPFRLSPVLSDELQALNARLAAEGFAPPDGTLMDPDEGQASTLEAARRWNVDMPPLARRAEVTVPADAELGSADVRCLVLVPEGRVDGILFFVHGGGFAFCSPETHERAAALQGIASGMAVVLPDYRRSPRHPYPAGLLDTVAALRAVLDDAPRFGLDPGPVIVSGDSAGANLGLCAILQDQRRPAPGPAGAVLFYGVFGADFETESYRVFDAGPGLTRPKMRRYWDWYLPETARRDDPLAAPIRADDAALSALPPLHLSAAGVDPLLSDTLGLAARLRGLGRSDSCTVVPGVTHGFLQLTTVLAAARDTIAEAGQAARRMIEA